MGVDTNARLAHSVVPSEIVSFLENNYKIKDITTHIDRTTYKDGSMSCISGWIGFDFISDNVMESRSMFYVRYDDTPEVYISLRNNEIAIEIIESICEHFGGIFTENDCNDEEPVLINPKAFEKWTNKSNNEFEMKLFKIRQVAPSITLEQAKEIINIINTDSK